MRQSCLHFVLGARVLVSERERESKLESELEHSDHSCSLSARGYLAGGEQKALRDVVGLIGEELVHLSGDLYGGFAQPQQRNVDAVAQNVLDHHLGLAGDSAAEELAQMVLLQGRERER